MEFGVVGPPAKVVAFAFINPQRASQIAPLLTMRPYMGEACIFGAVMQKLQIVPYPKMSVLGSALAFIYILMIIGIMGHSYPT
jgi:hypothetical protein